MLRIYTYSAPPDSIAAFKWPTSKGREGKRESNSKGRERKGKDRVGEGRGGCLPPSWGVWIRQ